MCYPKVHPLSVSLSVLLAVLVGCGGYEESSTEDEEVEVDDSAITDGRVEKGYASAGLVETTLGAFCSGVLIAPDVVLTASHCALSDFGVEPPRAFWVGPGKDVSATANEVPASTKLRKFPAGETVSFGKKDDILSDACPHTSPDVAMFRLTKPVPGVKPAQFGAEPEVGETCTVVGYGHHENESGRSTKMRRRSADLSLVEILPKALHMKRGTGISEGGDSGGPLYCAGKVVAITSCGAADTYQTDDYYARLAPVRARIDAKLAAWR